MSEHVSINGLEFAEKSLKIHGRISPSQLDRVADSLSPGGGDLQFELQGSLDEQGVHGLLLHVHGWLGLACQRCLGPLQYALDTRVRFALVRSEQELPAMDEERDDVDYLVVDGVLDVTELIEDEVLLSLPLAPVHEQGPCAEAARQSPERKESPFKVLQGLKKAKE